MKYRRSTLNNYIRPVNFEAFQNSVEEFNKACNNDNCSALEVNTNNIIIAKARRKGFWNIPYNPLDNES